MYILREVYLNITLTYDLELLELCFVRCTAREIVLMYCQTFWRGGVPSFVDLLRRTSNTCGGYILSVLVCLDDAVIPLNPYLSWV